MKLLLDCGNTRLKWRLLRGHQVREGSLSWEEFSPQDLAEDWQQAVCALGSAQDHPQGGLCSVAQPALEARARAALEAFCACSGVFTLTTGPRAVLGLGADPLTLENPYRDPECLGRDRWAAALGLLWELSGRGLPQPDLTPPDLTPPEPSSLLHRDRFCAAIVSVGTATVVDQVCCVREDGGWTCALQPGSIQPGLRVGADALSIAAPALREGLSLALAQRALGAPGASTEQALLQGLMASQLGALLWLQHRQAIDAVWLHGGDAGWWQAALKQSPWGQTWPVYQAPLIFSGLLAAMTPGYAQ